MADSCKSDESAPAIIVTTPAGQLHEFGALMAVSTACADGWRTYYLGPNLPAEEIAEAARRVDAGVVGLSIIYPGDDPETGREIERLAGLLRDGVDLLIGGRVAKQYEKSINRAGAVLVNNLEEFRSRLEDLRSRQPAPGL